MSRIRVLIADDHGVVREGLRSVLNTSDEFRVVAEAQDGESAVALAREFKPDIAIMDISMPKLNGLEATALLKKQNPETGVIILSIHEDEEYVYQVLRAGARGYVLKSAGRKEIFSAIRAAMTGERFFSPGVSKIIVDSFLKRANQKNGSPLDKRSSERKLTKREAEILNCIVQGLTNRKIADLLFLSVRTINTHRTNLMKKLDIHDTARLVRYAIEAGLVSINAN